MECKIKKYLIKKLKSSVKKTNELKIVFWSNK